jgi:hypothetical protein
MAKLDLNKFSDTQLMILNAGNVNPDHNILPHNEGMKARGVILTAAIKKLEDGGLIAKKNVPNDVPGVTRDGEHYTYILTRRALAALNGEEEVEETTKAPAGRDINIAKNPATGNPTANAEAKAAKDAEKAAAKDAKAAEKAAAKEAKDKEREEKKAAREAAKAEKGEAPGKSPRVKLSAEDIAADMAWREIAKKNKGKTLYPVEGAAGRPGTRRGECLLLIQQHPTGIIYDEVLKSGASAFDIYALVYYKRITARFVEATEAVKVKAEADKTSGETETETETEATEETEVVSEQTDEEAVSETETETAD